jgi:hypothetical protein
MAIPLLIMLLNRNNDNTRSSTVSALAKLADYGEFIAVGNVDIANASVKLSFIKRLKRKFHRSFNLLKAGSLMLD